MSKESKPSSPPPEILQAFGLQGNDWDVIIVGDGSGSRYGYPGGWASVLFDRRTGIRKVFYGALSDTTVNICELSPYIYTMQWYVRELGKDLHAELYKKHGMHITPRVCILTDCEIIANQGNRVMDRKVNAALWAAMDYFGRLNYRIEYKWIPRESLAANRLCDELSKDMRHFITSIEQRLDTAALPDPHDDQYGTQPAEVPA